jgi:hypothetical protein
MSLFTHLSYSPLRNIKSGAPPSRIFVCYSIYTLSERENLQLERKTEINLVNSYIILEGGAPDYILVIYVVFYYRD